MENYKKSQDKLNRVFVALRTLSPLESTRNEELWPKTRDISDLCDINIYISRYYLMKLVKEKKAAVSEGIINNSKRWCITEPKFKLDSVNDE